VILESDALRPGYSWVFIQRELARETRACWYDRAGYGWSDPGPTPHISASSAADLHELLRRSGVQPPYLMVGDGFGSLNVRVYRGLYPQEVAGMVLLDPIDEGEEQMGMASRVPFHLGYPPGFVLRAVNRVGLMRLFPRARPQAVAPRRLTSEEQDTLSGLEGEPKMHAAFLAEQGFSRSLEEVRSSGGLGNLPLVVVRGSSSQRMQSEAPEAVVQSVLKLVEALRHQ
jgi:pimeloyl-ACP methyl ester carboxylesterase